jgi:F-type H+-transporting ATPase subunit epsilon
MPLELIIVTPEGQDFSGPVQSVVLPGVEGDFGVLEGHEPFLSALRIGGIEVTTEDGRKRYASVSRGYAEIHGDAVSVMVGTCEWADQIDRDRAERARERAKKALEEVRKDPAMAEQVAQFEDAYEKAITRLEVVGQHETRH